MREDCVFFCPVRVRYSEVDAQGIVYNAHYITYTDVALTEFFRHKGHTLKSLAGTNFQIAHVKTTIEYYSSAFIDDVVEVGVRVLRIGNKSFTLGCEMYRQSEEKILCSAELVFSGYDRKNRTSIPIPDLVRNILEG